MGLFKQIATAMKPSNVARGLEAARGPQDPAAIEASLAALTPEQRAAYDANMAEVARGQAAGQASWEEARVISVEDRILGGPAGRYLYGAGPDDLASPEQLQARIAEVGPLAAIREQRALRGGEFRDGLRQTFNRDKVRQVTDPAERESTATAERAARDEGRVPYRAADAPTVVFQRVATRGDSQLADVLDHLQTGGLAARPDRVFGVYRVPDRISPTLTPHSERRRAVEWDVVHAPTGDGPQPAAERPEATSFLGADRWVARRIGEPTVLDEELAAAFCEAAGIGPERCFGLARISEFRSLQGSGDESTWNPTRTLVRGVVVLHPPVSAEPFEAMRGAAPIDLVPGTSSVLHEVLNWAEIARAVHPKIFHPPPVPSPFPYLPATPQELLEAYLEIVGIAPEDCYGVQATVDHPRELAQGGVLTTNMGPRQPCADGKPRMRAHGCEQVVVSYRDRPVYAAGRERWDAYQQQVLQADLRKGLELRVPLDHHDDLDGVPTGILRGAIRLAERVEQFWDAGDEPVPPVRYCWPPMDVDARQ